MEQLNVALIKTLGQLEREQPSNMGTKRSAVLRNLKQPSTSAIVNGENALDLIDSPEVSVPTFTKAMAMVQANFGVEYDKTKAALLFDMIREDRWSEERFVRTLKWFLKNKPFPSWTMADWFNYSIKVYPLQWLQGSEYTIGDVYIYRLPDGVFGVKPLDGNELPFEGLKFTPAAYKRCGSCDALYDAQRQNDICQAGVHPRIKRTGIFPP
jgi:hypothetical protein